MEKHPQSSSKYWQSTLFWGLFIFTLGVAFVAILGEFVKTKLIWYMRYTDFFDLLINLPLYLISLILFIELFIDSNSPRSLRITFLCFALLFIYGNAMRTSANAINTFATEIRDYPDLPRDMYALIYFLDETLGHIIIDIMQFCVFGCLLVLEVKYLSTASTARYQWWAAAAGGIYGLMEAVNFIEGQKAILVPVVLIGLGAVWLWLKRSRRQTLKTFIKTGPATAFLSALLVFFPCGMGLYWITFGSFTEPSELKVTPAYFIPLGIFLALIALGALFFYLHKRRS